MSNRVYLLGFDGANPDLIRRYVDEGAMPNVARLMERGVFGEYLSSVPMNTTVNWTTIATGAHPGTHGIADFWLHFPGEPLDKFHEAFDSALVQAEQIWHTADRAGKRALVTNYPVCYPLELEHGFFIGGEGTPFAGSIFELRPSSCFVTEAAAEGTERAEHITFDNEWKTVIRLDSSLDDVQASPEFALQITGSESANRQLKVYSSSGELLATLSVRTWTDWLAADWTVASHTRVGRFRLYLSELSENGERFKLYVSQVWPEDGYTQPAALAAELLDVAGPHLNYCGAGPWRRGWCDIGAWFDEMRYKGHWMARAASYVINKYEVDLYYSHFHILDHVFHYIWGWFDPASAWYDASRAEEFEQWIREAHVIVDETVGMYVDALGDDANIVMISDHGLVPHVKSVSINNLLAQAGLLAWEPGADGAPVVDWSRTVAFKPTDAVHIWLNLKGRDPDGIVDPADYESAQERVIRVLLDFTDPDTGGRPVAVALKKKDAAAFGIWGERAGDVIVMMNAEYSAQIAAPLSADGRVLVKMGPWEEGDESSHSAECHAVHGYTLPTNKLGRGGSEAGMILLAGPGLKRGERLTLPVPAVNVAPTVAHLLGIDPPAQCEGQAHFRALK